MKNTVLLAALAIACAGASARAPSKNELSDLDEMAAQAVSHLQLCFEQHHSMKYVNKASLVDTKMLYVVTAYGVSQDRYSKVHEARVASYRNVRKGMKLTVESCEVAMSYGDFVHGELQKALDGALKSKR